MQRNDENNKLSEKQSALALFSATNNGNIPFLQSKVENTGSDFVGSEPQCRFHFFHMYLKIGYYYCFIPFCPVFYAESGHYVLKINRAQKVLCFLTWTFVLINRLTQLRITYQTTGKHPTIFYFNLGHSHAHAILNIIFYWTFYTKTDEFKTLIETVGHCSLLYHADKYRQRWIMMVLAYASWLTLGMFCPIIGYDVIDSREWSPSFLFRSYVGKARYTFFLHSNLTLAGIPPELSEISNFEALLGVLQILVNWMHDNHMFLMTCVFGICSITIWIAVTNFQNVVQSFGLMTGNNSKITGALLIDQFHELKSLADSVNSVWHLFCFWYILDVTLWMATDLDYAFRTIEWFVKLHIFYFLLYGGTIMILSAESFRKMQWFKLWLLKPDNRQIFWKDRKVTKILLQELEASTIGIGSSGFFQFDYNFIAQISGMIITFFIISVQYA